MKVILSGGGSGEQTTELDTLFASLLNKSKSLLYIPLAIDDIKHPYPDCLKWLKSTFDNLGVTKYEVWAEQDLYKSKEISPEKFSGIYIGGGNTFYLMHQLKKSGFWNFLIKAIEKDIPIYGGSAGAKILSKSLRTAKYYDKNWNQLKNLNGANLCKGYDIICHYKEEGREKVNRILSLEKLKLVLLTERSGLYNNGEKVVLIGKDPSTVINKNKEFILNPGEELH